MKLGVLVGNSSLRLSLRDGEQVVRSRSNLWRDADRIAADVTSMLDAGAADEVLLASVRDDLLARVRDALAVGSPSWSQAGIDFSIPIENRYERPEEVGIDRLLNAVAARRLARGRGAIALDFGTAISATVVTPDGAFAGGLIAAGGSTILRGLEVSTPRLPAVEAPRNTRFLQGNTAGAIEAGVFFQVVGGVRELLRGLRAELGGEPLVVATGGEARLFVGELPEIDRLELDLTMDGLFLAASEAASG